MAGGQPTRSNLMTHYIFNESGIIPGVPGSFANCRVDIDETIGEVIETPLSVHPAFVPSGQESAAPEETPVQHLEALEQEVETAIVQAEHPETTELAPPAQAEG